MKKKNKEKTPKSKKSTAKKGRDTLTMYAEEAAINFKASE